MRTICKFLSNPATASALSVLSIGVFLGTSIWNYVEATKTRDAVVESIDANRSVNEQIAGVAQEIRDYTGSTDASLKRIEDRLGSEQPLTADPSPSREPEPASRDLGLCQPGFTVRVGEQCSTLGPQPFEVLADGAYSPWDTRAPERLNRETIKVDPPEGNVTFQARRQPTGDWVILASGQWENTGTCARQRILRPGQYCIEQRSGDPFRVYATDELNPDDMRPLYPDGYGVLFSFPSGEIPSPVNGRLGPSEVWSGDHFRAMAIGSGLWRIEKAD